MNTLNTHTGTILIVDDHQENLQVLSSMLKKQGYRVRQAITATLALKSIRKIPPDLILLDIMLPDMDGYDVCKQLKADERTREIPVVFLSALGGMDDKLKAFDSGGVDYLIKPFQAEEVLARVKTHVTLAHTRKLLEQEIHEHKRAEEQLSAALAEKDVLMREILHRTKNNMSTIINLLYLQSVRIEDERITQNFREIENRIRAMLLVQQKLYQSHDVANIALDEYLEDLAVTVFRNVQLDERQMKLLLDLDPVTASPDTAIPCGLLLSELITNASKYAFPAERTNSSEQVNELRITLHVTEDGDTELSVKDNGIGLPEDFNVSTATSLGLQLVMSFVAQLLGTLELKRENGTEFLIRFKNSDVN